MYIYVIHAYIICIYTCIYRNSICIYLHMFQFIYNMFFVYCSSVAYLRVSCCVIAGRWSSQITYLGTARYGMYSMDSMYNMSCTICKVCRMCRVCTICTAQCVLYLHIRTVSTLCTWYNTYSMYGMYNMYNM